MQKINYFLIILFLVFPYFNWGQNPFYYKIDKSKGLPSNNIYDIYQDSKGFMWFASNLGLCKFDGKNFLSYSNDIQTSKAGSNIKEDKYGRIWYSNFDGYLYYVENGILKALNNKNTIGFVKFGIVNDYLFVVQKNNILIYELKNIQLAKIIPVNTDELIATHSNTNAFYFLCKNLTIIDKNLTFKKVKLNEDITINFPAAIFQDSSDGLLFVSKYAKHFYIYNKGHFSKKIIEGKFNFLQNLSYDGTTNWVCTTQGVIKYKDNSINTQNTYFKDFNISYVFKDKQDNYWFSTISEGILLVPNLENNFISFDKKPNVINVLNKQLYIGTTNDKIYKSDIHNFKFTKIFDGATNHEIYFINSDSITNKLFFTSNTFKIKDLKTNELSENIIALKDAQKIDQTYYAFAGSGLCGFLKISDKKSNWDDFIKANSNPFDEKLKLYSCFKDIQGKSATYNPFNQTVYFATSSGLFAMNRSKKIELKFNNASLYFSKIKNFNNYVIGLTTNEHIYTIDSKNKIKLFSSEQYTNGEKIIKFKIIKNFLFLFTPYSIYEYNLLSKSSRKIIALNPEFEITDLAKIGTKLILANSRGFLILNNLNNSKTKHPKFIVNSIEVNGKKRKIIELENLIFNENNININFSILSFIPNQKNRLYYKINNQNWQLLDDESRNFKLNSLAPGKYQLLFLTEFENKKSPITKIIINIEEPFWLSFSFISFIIFLCLGLILWLYRINIKKINKRNQLILDKINLEKNVNQSKLKAIKSQMNPHFFYNALNTLQSYILSNEKKEAIDYLSKFSNLTRTILEMTEKDWISISDEIKTLTLYLDIEKARFDNDLNYSIIVDPYLDIDSSKIPSMLIQPYVENAIKHGLLHKKESKILNIGFDKIDDTLTIKIDDNGIGRQKSNALNQIKNKNHQSFATDALQSRIDLLNQYNKKNITIEIIDKYTITNLPSGTTVLIKIPLVK